MKIWPICIVAATVAIATPAWPQGTLAAPALKLYGGTYSSDCGNSTASRLRVVGEALTVEEGTQRMTGRNVETAYSYLGPSPPADYQERLRPCVDRRR